VARRGGIRRADYPSDEARSAPVKSRRRRSLNIKPSHWLGTYGLDDRDAALLLRWHSARFAGDSPRSLRPWWRALYHL